jgi:hypothetical protein
MLQDFEVWGIDPGVSQVFVASKNSAPRAYLDGLEVPDDELLAPPENVRHQIRTFSSAEFYCTAGFPKTNAKIKEWKQASGIDVVESGITSPKTASFDRLTLHIRTKMAVLDRLLMFYGQDIQQLRFLNYHGRQKATREMVKIFVDGGKKYGRHPDQGNSFDVHQYRWKPDGSKKQRRRKFPNAHQSSTE